MNNESMLNLLRAAGVNRWHTEPFIPAETNSQHQFMAAIIAEMIMDSMNVDCSFRLGVLQACLYHDMGEHWSGDIPAHAKWKLPLEMVSLLSDIEDEARLDNLNLAIPPINGVQHTLLLISDWLSPLLYCASLVYGQSNKEALIIVHRLLDRAIERSYDLNELPDSAITTIFFMIRNTVSITNDEIAMCKVDRMEKSAWQKLRRMNGK